MSIQERSKINEMIKGSLLLCNAYYHVSDSVGAKFLLELRSELMAELIKLDINAFSTASTLADYSLHEVYDRREAIDRLQDAHKHEVLMLSQEVAHLKEVAMVASEDENVDADGYEKHEDADEPSEIHFYLSIRYNTNGSGWLDDFELVGHGYENAQYFQGCGVVGTEFNYVVTGIGGDDVEALEDALEQIATVGVHITGAKDAEMQTALHDAR